MKTLNIIFEPTENFDTVKKSFCRERKSKNNRKQCKKVKNKIKFINSHIHARRNDVAHTLKKETHTCVSAHPAHIQILHKYIQKTRKYASAKNPVGLFSKIKQTNKKSRKSLI